MANVRMRLRSLYGDAFKLNVHNREPHGVEVSISVPYSEGRS
jgi:LytS/YehU family sensor histidine kinase